MRVCIQCDQVIDSPQWQCEECHFTPGLSEGFLAFSPLEADAEGGFNPELFSQLAALEDRNFWFQARNRLILSMMQHYFPEAQTMLEIGCGTGFVLSGLKQENPALQVFGSEIFAQGLQYAAQRIPEAELFQMDARFIPFREEFDVIGAFDVLEHIPEDEAVLVQMYKALKQGGHSGIILTVPQYPLLWSPADDWAHHVRRYQAAELRQKLETAGFRIQRMTSFVSLLLPALAASRWLQRILPPKAQDPLAELRIHPVLNQMFRRVMAVELAWLQRGKSLPCGGSLLAVATL